MLPVITQKSKTAFEEACKNLGLTPQLPDFSILRPDLGLYLTATYMLSVIIESGKNGQIRDYNDHSKLKYYPWPYVENGYETGSSGGGFSCSVYVNDVRGCSCVGARLTFNSEEDARKSIMDYPDLWEIVILDCR